LISQQRREHFRRRADLENRIAVQRTRIALLQLPVGNHPPPMRPDNAHGDPDALMLHVDSIDEHLPNLGIRRHGRLTNGLGVGSGVKRNHCNGDG
jgi:hypothetical protein